MLLKVQRLTGGSKISGVVVAMPILWQFPLNSHYLCNTMIKLRLQASTFECNDSTGFEVTIQVAEDSNILR